MSAPDPDCPDCFGTGMVPEAPDPPHPPKHTRCTCVLRRDVLANVERGMPGLTKAPVIKTSPLLGKEATNMWITAGSDFFAHLRHVAVRQPMTWFLRVTSDSELVASWLADVALKGGDIIDPDAYMVRTKFLSIADVVVPPDLIVIRMGVKVARNEASPEVLAEALRERAHLMRPTWVWDEPGHPLNSGHLFWSKDVQSALLGYERVTLEPPKVRKQARKKKQTTDALGTGRRTMRGDGK